MSYRNKRIILVTILVLVFVLPIFIWAFHFNWNHYSISDNSQDWADFGDYLSGIYSALTLIATIAVVYIADKLSRKNENDHDRKKALLDIYNHLSILLKTNSNNRIQSIYKLSRLINDYDFFLSDELKKTLLNLYDELLDCDSQKRVFNRNKINNVKNEIRKYYDGKQ